MKVLIIIAIIASFYGCECAPVNPGGCEYFADIPIRVLLNSSHEQEVLTKINEALGYNLYVAADDADSAQVTIEYKTGKELDEHGVSYLKGWSYNHCGNDEIIDSAEIEIRNDYEDSSRLLEVLAHELFHASGYSVHEGSGLMYCKISYTNDGDLSTIISEDTLDYFYFYYGQYLEDDKRFTD